MRAYGSGSSAARCRFACGVGCNTNAAIDFYYVDRWREYQGGGVYYNQKVDDAIGDSLPHSYDILPVLAAHPVPVIIIQRDHDYADPAASLWVKDNHDMNKVRVYVIKEAGHYSWIDDPTTFKQDLRRALRSAFGEAMAATAAVRK